MVNHPYKAALVTGASRRIGEYIVKSLAKNGLKVAVHFHHSSNEAKAVADSIQADGGTAVILSGDLGNPDETQSLVQSASDLLGCPIDVLVNNASIFEEDSLETLTVDSWVQHNTVNALAPLLLTQALAKNLPNGQAGLIINMIDQRVLKLNPLFMSYTASKSSLWTLTRTTAQALASQNIRVNAISPGPTLANEHEGAEGLAREIANIPLKRGPSLKEFATTLTFMLETPSMTGQMVALDGGQHLCWQTPDVNEV